MILDRGPFRLVGVGAFDLTGVREAEDQAAQLDLGLDPDAGRNRRLEEALDAVTEKFGSAAVYRAADLVRTRDIGVAMSREPLDEDEI